MARNAPSLACTPGQSKSQYAFEDLAGVQARRARQDRLEAKTFGVNC